MAFFGLRQHAGVLAEGAEPRVTNFHAGTDKSLEGLRKAAFVEDTRAYVAADIDALSAVYLLLAKVAKLFSSSINKI